MISNIEMTIVREVRVWLPVLKFLSESINQRGP